MSVDAPFVCSVQSVSENVQSPLRIFHVEVSHKGLNAVAGDVNVIPNDSSNMTIDRKEMANLRKHKSAVHVRAECTHFDISDNEVLR